MPKKKPAPKTPSMIAQAEEIVRQMPAKRRGKRGNLIAKSWEPSERDLLWYFDVKCRYKTCPEVAAKAGVSAPSVFEMIQKVGEYIRSHTFPQIMQHRIEQTAVLENIAREMYGAWERSKGTNVVKTMKSTPNATEGTELVETVGETTVRTEELIGDPRFLSELRAALADIRKIWGVEKPIEAVIHHAPFEDLVPIGGMTRDEARRAQAEAVLRKLDLKAKADSEESEHAK